MPTCHIKSMSRHENLISFRHFKTEFRMGHGRCQMSDGVAWNADARLKSSPCRGRVDVRKQPLGVATEQRRTVSSALRTRPTHVEAIEVRNLITRGARLMK